MSKYKVTNLTQGQIELKPVKRTLGPGAWTVVSEGEARLIQVSMSGGRGQQPSVKVVEIAEKDAPKGPSAVPPAQGLPKQPPKSTAAPAPSK
jgi:hypothetical protein